MGGWIFIGGYVFQFEGVDCMTYFKLGGRGLENIPVCDALPFLSGISHMKN